MKWLLIIPQKYKTALLLMIIVTIVIATSFWGKSSVAQMNASFSSIYKDRLLPANELFHLADIMYQKRLLIENFPHHPQNKNLILSSLSHKNHLIDSILQEYQKTYLVAEESKSLKDFKIKMEAYNIAEQKLLCSNELKSGDIENNLIPLFNDIRSELITLSQIQTAVGRELMDDSEEIKASASVIHYCQITLILVIMLIVQGIILTAKSAIPKAPQDFRLN